MTKQLLTCRHCHSERALVGWLTEEGVDESGDAPHRHVEDVLQRREAGVLVRVDDRVAGERRVQELGGVADELGAAELDGVAEEV